MKAALCVAAAVIGLAGCGNHTAGASTQVAAKVGKYEITRMQVNQNMSNTSSIPPQEVPQIRSKILSQLVDEQLLLAEAQKLKIDRSPQVISAIDRARREIIVRAYIEQLASQQSQPDDNAVKAYYHEHPELFADRRIYTVKELTVDQTGQAAAQDLAASGKNIDQIAQGLQDKGLHFKADRAERAPESLPIDFLPQIANAKDGTVLTHPINQGLYLVQVVSARPAAVSLADATPSIQRFIQNEMAHDAVSHELARLKNENKIEYFGEFADAAHDGTQAVTTAHATPASTTLDATAIKNGLTGIR